MKMGNMLRQEEIVKMIANITADIRVLQAAGQSVFDPTTEASKLTDIVVHLRLRLES